MERVSHDTCERLPPASRWLAESLIMATNNKATEVRSLSHCHPNKQEESAIQTCSSIIKPPSIAWASPASVTCAYIATINNALTALVAGIYTFSSHSILNFPFQKSIPKMQKSEWVKKRRFSMLKRKKSFRNNVPSKKECMFIRTYIFWLVRTWD